MTRDKQLGILTVCAVLAVVLIGATDRNVAAWFTFGLSLATLALSGRIDDASWHRPTAPPRRRSAPGGVSTRLTS